MFIYNHLIKHNIPFDTLDMAVEVDESRQKSNYTIENILQSVICAPLSMTRVLAILNIFELTRPGKQLTRTSESPIN